MKNKSTIKYIHYIYIYKMKNKPTIKYIYYICL